MIKHFLKYFTGDMLARSVAIFSVPIYTYFLSPAEFGIYSVIYTQIGIATIILNLNVHTSIGRFFYDNNIDITSFMSTTISLSIAMLFVSFIFLFGLHAKTLSKLLGFNFDIFGIYFAILIFFGIFYSIYVQTLIPQKKSKEYSFLMTIQAYLRFVVSVVFLFFFERSALTFIKSVVIAEAILFVCIICRMKKYFVFRVKIDHVKYILSYSAMLIPYALSSIALAQIDRVMIGKLMGVKEVGIYSMSYSFGTIPLMIYAALSLAWLPNYYKNMNDNNYEKLDRDVLTVSYVILFFIVVYATYSGLLVKYLLNADYRSGISFIPLVAISMFYAVLWDIWGRGIGYSKKTFWASSAGIVSAVVNILLNYVLIPKFGLYGAVYATLFAYMLMALLGYLFSKHIVKVYTPSIYSLRYVLSISLLFVASLIFINGVVLTYLRILLPLLCIYLYFNNTFQIKSSISVRFAQNS